MAIEDIKKAKIGRELTDWVFLGVYTGSRRAAQNYRNLKADGRQADAEASLIRATNMARRAADRIDNFINGHDAINGVNSGKVYLDECLALVGAVNLTTIRTELNKMEVMFSGFRGNNQAGGTLDDLALEIETNIPLESDEWVFQFSDTYTDIVNN